MILSFGDKETEKVFNSIFSTKLPTDIQTRAYLKLLILHRAEKQSDLLSPPSNRLEKLNGYSGGYYSIRINKQWRICFIPIDEWSNYIQVSIVDYH